MRPGRGSCTSSAPGCTEEDDSLSKQRRSSMSEAEFFLHAPVQPGSAPEFVSVHNEWRVLSQVSHEHNPIGDAACEDRLRQLCMLPAEPAVRLAAQHARWTEMFAELGGSGCVQLAACSSGPRGLVLTRPVQAWEVVMRLPACSLLSEAAAKASELEPIISLIDEGEWTQHVLVILLLLVHRRHGRRSEWMRWLRLLPTELDCVAAWSDAELAHLEGCDCFWSARAARAELLEIRSGLMPKLEAAEPRLFAGGGFHEADWVWAKAVIETRALALPGPVAGLPAGTLVLAPGIDMLNHSEAPQLVLRAVDTPGGGELLVVARVPVAAHTEVRISYGHFDAEDLFLHHGFLTAPAALPARTHLIEGARHAVAPFRVAVHLQPCEALAAQADLLATVLMVMAHMHLQLDGWLEEPAADEPLILPPRLLGTARLCSLQTHKELEGLRVAQADQEPLSRENEKLALQLLRRVLTDAVSAFPKSENLARAGRRVSRKRLELATGYMDRSRRLMLRALELVESQNP